jgi:hypothetical protein
VAANRAFGVSRATAILHAVADRPLVNIQPDVIHSLHGGASYGVSESVRSLSSAFVDQALLLRPVHSNLGVANSSQVKIGSLPKLMLELDEKRALRLCGLEHVGTNLLSKLKTQFCGDFKTCLSNKRCDPTQAPGRHAH